MIIFYVYTKDKCQWRVVEQNYNYTYWVVQIKHQTKQSVYKVWIWCQKLMTPFHTEYNKVTTIRCVISNV